MKRITVVTGSRADYGLLKPLLELISVDKRLELRIIATGMHLAPEFGLTYKEIENDGFRIDGKVEMLLSSDSSEGISKSIGLGIISFAEIFESLLSDLIVILGDRTEMLSVAVAALIKGIPLAHIHGGETTEGAYDEAIRHSITKMSHLHFAATEPYRKRIIQLGESPDCVFNVGAIGIDSIMRTKLMNKDEFEKFIELKLGGISALVTFHSVTFESGATEHDFGEVIQALTQLESINVIFTMPNSDKGGRIIIQMINDFVSKNRGRAVAYNSLGQLGYLSALNYVDMVIGNSSSGIIEAPVFHKPTINIGYRQKGRIMCDSVINVSNESDQIIRAIQRASSKEFKKNIQKQKNPYGKGNASKQILDVLKKRQEINLKKVFYDIDFIQ